LQRSQRCFTFKQYYFAINLKTTEIIDAQLPVRDLAYSQLLRLFLVTRLHAAAKFYSRDMASITHGKKNRKATKVMHL